MAMSTGQKGLIAGLLTLLGIAGGALAYDNRKRKVTVDFSGCDNAPAHFSFYIWAWKDPIADPQGTVRFFAGICRGPSCGQNMCKGFLPLARGFYRIAVVDNKNNIYYSKDLTITEDVTIPIVFGASNVGPAPLPLPSPPA